MLASAIVLAIVMYQMNHYGKYSYEEAKQKCAEKGMVLPLTLDDFFESGYRFGQPAEYWTADGKLVVPQTGGRYPPEKENIGYSYICVKTNGQHKKMW